MATRLGVDGGGKFTDLSIERTENPPWGISAGRPGRHPLLVRGTVLARIEELRPALDAHAGGVELVAVEGGVVRLRFTGMCTGCPLRPVTTASTIRPALLELDGVTAVEIEGSRISAEAEARIAAAFAKL